MNKARGNPVWGSSAVVGDVKYHKGVFVMKKTLTMFLMFLGMAVGLHAQNSDIRLTNWEFDGNVNAANFRSQSIVERNREIERLNGMRQVTAARALDVLPRDVEQLIVSELRNHNLRNGDAFYALVIRVRGWHSQSSYSVLLRITNANTQQWEFTAWVASLNLLW